MLALVLFAVGTVAAVELFQRSQAGATDGENTLIATYLAQRRLEELRTVAYGSLSNESETAISNPSGYSRFCRDATITIPYTNLKQVVVNIYWSDASCNTQPNTKVTLQTYRSNI